MSPRIAFAALLCLSTLPAQAKQGEFVCAAAARGNTALKGGLYLVNPAGTVASLNATGALTDSYSVACDTYTDSVLWVGTTQTSATASPGIYRVVAAAGKILSTTEVKASLKPADGAVLRVLPIGDELLFLTQTQLSMVPKTGGTPRVLRTFSSTTAAPTDIACDGGVVYLHLQPFGNILADHVELFLLKSPGTTTVSYTAPGLTTLISSISLDPSSNLLVVENEAFTGASTAKVVNAQGKVLQSLSLPFTYGTAGARLDPAGGFLVVCGMRYDTTKKAIVREFVSYLNGKLFKSAFGTSTERFGRIDIRRAPSMHRFGHACVSKISQQPLFLSATGRPAPASTDYAIHLGGDRNAKALLLIGLHGGMTQPFPLSVMGAGDCVLGVRSLVELGLVLDGNGVAVLKPSIPQALLGLDIDLQFLALSPQANTAGFLSSQVGSIVVR